MTLGASEHMSGGYVRDPDERLVVVQAGTGFSTGLLSLPGGATVQNVVGSNAANASATATLPAAVGKTTYITGFTVEGLGATAETIVIGTITNLSTAYSAGTITFPVAVPLGATVRLSLSSFFQAIPASATNTTIVVTVPAAGAGNTNMMVAAYGYQI